MSFKGFDADFCGGFGGFTEWTGLRKAEILDFNVVSSSSFYPPYNLLGNCLIE
jgi:hypothetical protein